MPIRAECPAGHVMMVPDHRAGSALRCPRCGKEVKVPGETANRLAHDAVPSQHADTPRSPDRTQPIATAGPVASSPAAPRGLAPFAAASVSGEALVEAPPLPHPGPANKPRDAAVSGWSPPAAQRSTAFYLAVALAALALFGVSPAVWEWFELWRNPDQPPVPPWVYALLITGVLQLAYAVYLAQIPDWSALWATTIATLAAAAAWATLLGATLLGRDESALVMLFRYADKLAGNRAAMWCFIMLCLSSVLAYFLGHTASGWQRSYRLLRKVRDA